MLTSRKIEAHMSRTVTNRELPYLPDSWKPLSRWMQDADWRLGQAEEDYRDGLWERATIAARHWYSLDRWPCR